MAELARGKTGRVFGHLTALLTLMKGQPLTYNKDNQEDKEPLFDTVDTLAATLRIMAEMVGGIVVRPEAMERAASKGYATATDLADYLVKKGVPFRDAHEVVAARGEGRPAAGQGPGGAAAGRRCERSIASIGEDVYATALTLRASLKARNGAGGTAPERVREQIAAHRARLG